MNNRQSMKIISLMIEISNPTLEFINELEEAYNNKRFMYIDRFIYGIPEMIMPSLDSPETNGLIITVQPMPDLLDPWAVTQDIKDALEENDIVENLDDYFKNGDFSDDPLE